MCGIMGYIGGKDVVPILLDGLSSLEYRGYDSAGLYTPGCNVIKAAGKVSHLRELVAEKIGGNESGDTIGIAHTRWATHGEPTTKNAHPHVSKERVSVVHNGIIENYLSLKERLVAEGYDFITETDTETIAHLIDSELVKHDGDFQKAFLESLAKLKGAYGLAVMFADDPNHLYVARMGSPLVLGIGDGEYIVASDSAPIVRHTREMVFLEDGDVAILSRTGHQIMNHGELRDRQTEHIDYDVDDIKKGGYDHYMMKEITEAPDVIRNSIRGRIIFEEGNAKLGGIESVAEKLKDIERLVIVGCGTAYLAGSVGEYIIEELAEIPVEVEVGSEFRYRHPVLDKKTAVLAISQSGETADTLEALREAKRKGIMTLGIVNVVGSTIARETDAGIYNHIGPEIAVASTKAFISAITILILLGVFLGRQRGLSQSRAKKVLKALQVLPDQLQMYLQDAEAMNDIEKVASRFAHDPDLHSLLYIGRRYQFPIAYEGALKLKEVSYLHAEGYGAGEMKHGPLAMIDEHFPTVAIATHTSLFEKMISNLQEIKARRGPIIAIANRNGDSENGGHSDMAIEEVTDHIFYVPKSDEEMVQAIINTVPMQLFAYHVATAKGLNVDQPRNLAKSVTVE